MTLKPFIHSFILLWVGSIYYHTSHGQVLPKKKTWASLKAITCLVDGVKPHALAGHGIKVNMVKVEGSHHLTGVM